MRASATLLLAVVAVALPTGCGKGGGPHTYTDERYGFSITLAGRFVKTATSDQTDRGAYGVQFADRAGGKAGPRYGDSLTVDVIDLGQPLDTADPEALRQALRDRGAGSVASLGTDVQTSPPADVTVDGLPGVVIPFAATVGGVRLLGWDYLLVKGSAVYVLLATSRSDHWQSNASALKTAVESFRVP